VAVSVVTTGVELVGDGGLATEEPTKSVELLSVSVWTRIAVVVLVGAPARTAPS
jgi:hypothetical protein